MGYGMKRIFITGGSGFIGTALHNKFADIGHAVEIYDIADNPANDVCDYDSLKTAIKRFNPNYVIHLGMTSKVTDANNFPTYARESIVGGTMNVLEAVKEYGMLDRLVFASSSTVYGDFIPTLSPPSEEHPTAPVNGYGALKLCAEVLIKSYNKMYGIEYSIIRPSSVYGPRDYNLRVIGKFFIDAFSKGIIVVNGKDMKVDFSYIDDVVNGFVAATLKDGGKNETFNITRGETRTLIEAAEIVRSYVYDSEILVKDKNQLFPQRGAFDISKAKKLIEYKPNIDLSVGIGLCYDHMSSNLTDYIR
jgi:nucleoside-diphosphate-sugar epimerase